MTAVYNIITIPRLYFVLIILFMNYTVKQQLIKGSPYCCLQLLRESCPEWIKILD